MAEAAKPKGTDIEINVKDGRLSFFNVFVPQEFKDNVTENVRYTRNTNVLIPKKINEKGEYDPNGVPNPLVKILNRAMKDAIEKTWPGQDKKIPPERRCFRDGEPIDPDTVDPEVPGSGTRHPLYEGYGGHMFISANKPVKAKTREEANAAAINVQCIGPRKTAKKADGTPCFPRLTEADGMLYSGAFANVLIRIYGYDGKKDGNPDRVNASLEIVQFKRHGEAFGAKAPDAESSMDEEEGDDGFDTRASAADDDDDMI